ncbi:DUF418 domain-containing protein [uncultured Pseudokineococcus sp.]|uniref:DUF418 domain-containing protein n=1 Tax=uncultured Pseudokineococcus sp. TaxID=1642928 RepID=UPI002632AB48|nr:DUF418 domain-containing protein [uncultured Pseudokineococcus sp.]
MTRTSVSASTPPRHRAGAGRPRAEPASAGLRVATTAPPAIPPVPRAAPLTAAERSPVPDVARGVALLGIALANSTSHVTDRVLGPGFRPVDGTGADRATDGVVGLLVDNRAFPMFTLLVAHGLAVVVRRSAERGAPWPQARSLLLRRSLWLGAFGLAHLVLLLEGDVLLTYGLLDLALVLLVRASDRVLLRVGAAGLLPFLAVGGLDGVALGEDGATDGLPLAPDTYLASSATRALGAVVVLLGGPLLVVCFPSPAVVGLLLARRRVLERPVEHRALLRRLAVGGFALSAPGAVPLVLASVQVREVGPAVGYLLGVLHAGTGLAGAGAGAVALVALVGWLVGARQERATSQGRPWAPRRAWWVAAAVGKRSLTSCLLQSVVMAPLLAPWGAGLGVGAGTALVAAVGVATYALTAVVAVALERAGRAGPAEVLLRRLVYGRAASSA